MEVVILVVHIILALAIIGVVLLQPPENSSLGGLGGANPMAAGSRGQGNFLTRTTAILATLFIITSLVLAILSGAKPQRQSILDESVIGAETKEAPVVPAAPEMPAVPLAK